MWPGYAPRKAAQPLRQSSLPGFLNLGLMSFERPISSYPDSYGVQCILENVRRLESPRAAHYWKVRANIQAGGLGK
jgi:hypothetical protein